MSERLVAWRSKPSDAVVQTIRGLSSRMIYLVQRPGPTSFVLQEEGSEQKTKVLVGGRVTCSCCRQNEGQACAHTLFVMIKVLGVPPSNPLVWQGSLLDRELEEVIQCGNRLGGGKQHQKGKRALAGSVGEGKAKALDAKKPIDPDERCPICFEGLAEARETELLSCSSCGNHLHGRCIYVWARHQESLGRTVTCPLCRGDWGEVKWSRTFACDKRGVPTQQTARDRNKDTHYGTSCGKCSRAPLQGHRYTCVICRHFDLCEECFEGGAHASHPFVCQKAPGEEPVPAPRGEADLENFEFRPQASHQGADKAKERAQHRGAAQTPRPLRERQARSDAAGTTPARRRGAGDRPPTAEGEGEGAFGLSLMAVGTSVSAGGGDLASTAGRSTYPCSHGSVVRQRQQRQRRVDSGRRLRKENTRRVEDRNEGPDLGGTGLALGVMSLGITGTGRTGMA